jgi:Di-haem oxidoreductase, putative peroxidase
MKSSTAKLSFVSILSTVCGLLVMISFSEAKELIGESPRLGPMTSRTTQSEIESGKLSLKEVRHAGLKMFTTPFNKFDGFGDGPLDPSDTTGPGGRPTLQNNGTYLRVNGLDSQTCLECHGIISMATVPFTPGVGGSGGINSSAMFQPRFIDVEDAAKKGFAEFDGRSINPLSLFGIGGVQLVAREMTADLQELKAKALANPGIQIILQTKEVNFGTIVADVHGNLNTSGVKGVDPDLVVRPFGRKGEFSSVRQFDTAAMMFHFGMQPVEIVGVGADDDSDGVVNEVLVGEISALEIFLTTQERPFIAPHKKQAQKGFRLFTNIGCADCHRPEMKTRSHMLTYSYPEIETNPGANIFYSVDLTDGLTQFEPAAKGGIIVRMFSDLKRHDLGPALAENFHLAGNQRNQEFITAKLWGVADSAPYLHDGRALTLKEAIILHGGEAKAARDAFLGLGINEQNQLLLFLLTLRNPKTPNEDVLSDSYFYR